MRTYSHDNGCPTALPGKTEGNKGTHQQENHKPTGKQIKLGNRIGLVEKKRYDKKKENPQAE